MFARIQELEGNAHSEDKDQRAKIEFENDEITVDDVVAEVAHQTLQLITNDIGIQRLEKAISKQMSQPMIHRSLTRKGRDDCSLLDRKAQQEIHTNIK